MALTGRVRRTLITAVHVVLLGVLTAAVVETLVFFSGQMVRPPLQGLENQLVDLAFQARRQNKFLDKVHPDEVVIIDIDDASIAQMGRTQLWPRSFDAKSIAYIASGKPKAIGIDYLYTETDSLSPEYQRLLESKGFLNAAEITKAFSTDDQLTAALHDAGNVYLSFFDDETKKDQTRLNDDLNSLRYIKAKGKNDLQFPIISHPILPVSYFAHEAKAIGSIAMPTMDDGTVRHYRILQQMPDSLTDEKSYVGNFPFYMYTDAMGVADKDIYVDNVGIHVGEDKLIPLRHDGSFRINWMGDEEKIRYISYYKVWDELIPAEFFENKYVFFGTSASGLQDLKTTPTRPEMPGVEVHAVAFLNMMNQSYLREVSEKEALPYLLFISILLVSIFLLVRPLLGFLLASILVFGEMFGFVLNLVKDNNIVLPIVSLMLVTFLAYLSASLYTYFIRERKNRKLKSAFGSYVSPEIVEQITKDPGMLQLGGEKKELTVLFSDIRNFTSTSEKLDPQQIVAILNNYLSEMSETIFKRKGTIDKFIGDAIMAIFGAPIAQKDHAERACHVALDMMEVLKTVNAKNAELGFPPLGIGIGVNTGDMTVGNIGSAKRFDYTVIGDAVNIGSRLEGLTKFFGVDIIISETTKEGCTQEEFIFRELGSVQVKGKDKPIRAYELYGRGIVSEEEQIWLRKWAEAFASIYEQNALQALKQFLACSEIRPTDKSTKYYIQRLMAIGENAQELNMVIRMDEK